jgi:hypothetical protein
MMMHVKKTRNLRVQAETLRILSDTVLQHVPGGINQTGNLNCDTRAGQCTTSCGAGCISWKSC